ncbi:hypothetical protein KIN20_013908 [Parelaphostrongylus tenuis]|uniref:Uncharacterized protein n=1 Tax=Parelaphostrongylus tenuis TaxID=148309 RepID=A0AAD5QMZ0_PARTN|nr:hypothetical protein KIN20_013908 [Parelaphostrongylus tenuis]
MDDDREKTRRVEDVLGSAQFVTTDCPSKIARTTIFQYIFFTTLTPGKILLLSFAIHIVDQPSVSITNASQKLQIFMFMITSK